MRVWGVRNRSCDSACMMYNSMFEITAYFQKQDGGASFMPVQRAVVCGANEKMVRARMAVSGMRSAMRFCVAEDATSMTMPTNP